MSRNVKNVEYCQENIIKFKKGVRLMYKNNVFIMGDSYSTYQGYIPKGYHFYYSDERKPHCQRRRKNMVEYACKRKKP